MTGGAFGDGRGYAVMGGVCGDGRGSVLTGGGLW